MFIKENKNYNEQNYFSNIIVKPHYCTISEIEFLNNKKSFGLHCQNVFFFFS